MANKTLKTKIQLRRGSESTFQEKNPVLLSGEIYLVDCVDNDNQVVKIKIGTGSLHFNELPYYDRDLLKILGIDLADSKTIDFKDDKLTLKGFDDAHHGQMAVKDADLGLVWTNPVSDASLQAAVAAAEKSKNQAASSALAAGNSATDASLSAHQAERINEQTMSWVNDKFWWGTLEEYNALEEILEGTFYFVQI